jgi:hypothetical protein
MPNIIRQVRESIAAIIDSASHQNAASIAKTIGKELGLSGRMLDYTHIELRNKLNEGRFKKVPFNERMLLLPHCLRNAKECSAKYNDEGLECLKCNKCSLPKIMKMAEELGYKKIACVPGGSMIEKLVVKFKPKAVVGVACSAELNMAIDKMNEHGIPSQAVLLLKDGCKDTEANLQEIKEKVELIESPLKNHKTP